MGLDMFLHRNISTFGYKDRNIPDNLKKAIEALDEATHSCLSGYREEVGYWRKANHIHKWFVDNVQNGVDECLTYQVSIE